MSYPEIDLLYLNEDDMVKAGVQDMSGCIEAMEEMFKLMKVGDYRMGGANGNSHGSMVMFPKESKFPEMPVDGPDRRFMAMPAYLGGEFDMAGVKWYGSNAANRDKGLPRSILMLILNDKDTGAPKAFMSADILSAYRTGAVPGVGFKHFAKEDASTLAIIGPGVMSKTANTIPIPAVRVEDLIAEGKMTSDQIDDLGDILLGKKPVHRKDDEIVIYSVGGMPTEDVAWGTMVYRNALKKGIGQKLNLWDKPKMVV